MSAIITDEITEREQLKSEIAHNELQRERGYAELTLCLFVIAGIESSDFDIKEYVTRRDALGWTDENVLAEVSWYMSQRLAQLQDTQTPIPF